MGKSDSKNETIIRLFLNDLHSGKNAILIADSRTIHDVAQYAPKRRITLIEPSKRVFPFNVFKDVPEHRRALFADVVLTIVRGPSDVATTRIDKYIRTGVQTLLEIRGSSFLDLKPLLTNPEFRADILTGVSDMVLKDIWGDFETMTPKERREQTESTISRLLSFTLEPRIRHCIGHKDTTVFDHPHLVSLDDRELGDNAYLIGQLIMGQLYLYSLDHEPPTLYVLDAHHFPYLSTLVDRGTLPVFFGVQSIEQLGERIVTPQLVAFRTTVADAESLEPEFQLKHNQLHTSLPLLPDGLAYIAHGTNTIRIQTYPHGYKPTKHGKVLLSHGRIG